MSAAAAAVPSTSSSSSSMAAAGSSSSMAPPPPSGQRPAAAAVGGASSKRSGRGETFAHRVVCQYHPNANLIEDCAAGDLICPECGLVVGERMIDVGSEWRTFSNSDKEQDDPSRVGQAENIWLSGKGDLSTFIGTVTKGKDDGSFASLRNKRGLQGSDRALMSGIREVSLMADRINLPKTIVNRANTVFKQVHDTKALRGRSADAIASACIYIACRQEGVPRTFKEIVAISKTSKKEMGRCFKLILKTLETTVDIITTGDFMSRFCSNLGLPPYIETAAAHIAKKAFDLNLVPGRSPISVAAAAIYVASQASDIKRSTKEISDIAGVAEVTIKQAYRQLYPRITELFPDNFKFATKPQQLPTS